MCTYSASFETDYTTMHGRQNIKKNDQNAVTKCRRLQSEKYQCGIDTVSSPDDGHTVARNMYRSLNKYTKNQRAPSWLNLHFGKYVFGLVYQVPFYFMLIRAFVCGELWPNRMKPLLTNVIHVLTEPYENQGLHQPIETKIQIFA